MQLQTIDKSIYRKHLNRVIAAVIVLLAATSLASSTLLIHLLGEPGGSNFSLNLAGLAIGGAVIALVLRHYRQHPYMSEVMYVWRLKQELNRIYRKTAKLNAAAENDNPDALVILNFSYRGSQQLYELDDNTLTADQLIRDIQRLDDKIAHLGLNISTDDYHSGLLQTLD
ncbi:DUF3087 domain-containing protein [Aestuariirhabdus sp. LZHN29]|uniref:DUF3087 domain-containing protein n=1 Tax=Aestuariirhabdus sp. LZHN29 TaxID=3417462 RepID=UPI003CE8B73F